MKGGMNMIDKEIKKIINTKDFDLEQELMRLVCGLSTFTDRTHEEIEEYYKINYDNNINELKDACFNIYKDVEELKKKLK
jgi:predicted RNase H-like nuclease (RuvC/YqgF family)